MAKLGDKIGQIDIHKKKSATGDILGGIAIALVVLVVIGALAG